MKSKVILLLSIFIILIVSSCNSDKKTISSEEKEILLEARKRALEENNRLRERNKVLEDVNSAKLIDQNSKIENEVARKADQNKMDDRNGTSSSQYVNIDNASIVITNFLSAENSRDFSYIYSFYSPSLRRYYGHNNPTYTSLQNVYQKAWNATPYSKNSFINIDRINGNEFFVKINYEWSKNSNPSDVKSKYDNLKFVLDNNNKIIEVSSLN